MDTLEALGRRIETTVGLAEIVRTMKSLAAVSIRHYDRAASALAEYHRTIQLGLQVVLRAHPMRAPEEERTAGPPAAIIFGSDHGLCGRFNEQILTFARERLEAAHRPLGHCRVLAIGAQIGARLEAAAESPDAFFFLPGSVEGLTGTAESVLVQLDDWRREHGVERVLVFHNRRHQEAPAAPHMLRLIPVELHHLQDRPWRSRSLPTFTMDVDQLFAALIRQHIFFMIYQAGVESMASEQAARLTSMQAAERNIEERLEEMQAQYRRRRQQAITEELLDVVAGFETLRAATGDPGATDT
jgi:F-type H+-transporting ATPase subunit gamma